MFVKRIKFTCTVYPNMKVKDNIQFVGGEFTAITAEQVELLRAMSSIVKEVVDKTPAPEKVEEAVEEFKVPARWDIKRIKTEATKRGVKFPEDDMLKAEMVAFLEGAVNTKEDE